MSGLGAAHSVVGNAPRARVIIRSRLTPGVRHANVWRNRLRGWRMHLRRHVGSPWHPGGTSRRRHRPRLRGASQQHQFPALVMRCGQQPGGAATPSHLARNNSTQLVGQPTSRSGVACLPSSPRAAAGQLPWQGRRRRTRAAGSTQCSVCSCCMCARAAPALLL